MAEAEDDTQPAKKGNAKKTLVMALAGLVLLGSGVGGSLYFTGMLDGLGGGGAKETEAQEEKKEAKKVPIYFAFPEPFTVNFETEQGLRFLQVSIEVMTYEQPAVDGIQAHMPALKNNIILLLSNQSYGMLVTLEGKEGIRASILSEIKEVLKRHEVKADVEEVYFTTFVMQ
mgnify:CR=1 FL=1